MTLKQRLTAEIDPILASMGQADGLKKTRALRKERARMLTVLRERELAKQAGK